LPIWLTNAWAKEGLYEWSMGEVEERWKGSICLARRAGGPSSG
jgi:hypothetical protein